MAVVEDEKNSARATMRDVAALAGVPLSAVSLVLNGKAGVSEERRRKVLAAAEALRYVPAARSVSRDRPPVLGLVMERLSATAMSDGFIAEVVSGVQAGAERLGYQVLVHLYHPGVDPVTGIRALMGRDVDGFVVANGGDITEAVIDGIASTGVSVVLVENYLPKPVHAVVADNFTAGLTSTRRLLELGHRRIGILTGSDRYISLTDRRRGYVAALLEAGVPLAEELMPPQEPGHPKKGYAQMQRLLALPDPPTAVYAVSDKSAIGALDAVRESGRRVPDDLSLIGTDDVADSAYSSPPLTTFHVPKRLLGEMAVRTMSELLGNDPPPPSRLVLEGHLVERASCAPPRGLAAVATE